MTDATPRPHEPSGALLRGLAAALQRPVMLDPRAVAEVRGASAFHARAQATVVQPSDPGGGQSGEVAIVDVRGPLAQRAWSCFGMFEGDGYDAIVVRVQAALADPKTTAVLLRIDSPGGEVAGCFEAVRAIRALKAAAGKPMVAYVDEVCASAAYALACACDAIVAPDTGCVGSIGVITCLLEESRAMDSAGITPTVISSGARKADGHPAVVLSDEARAAIQAEIDQLAEVFAAEVAIARGGDAARWRGLEAAVAIGSRALELGLADEIGGLEAAIARAKALVEPAPMNSNTPSGRGLPARGSNRRGATTMSNAMTMSLVAIAAVLGMSADATEEDVLRQVKKTQAERDALASLAGTTDAEEAKGAIRAWKVSHERIGQIEAERAAEKAAAEKAERSALLAQGKASGAIDADFEREVLPEMSTAALRKYVGTAKPKVPMGKAHVEPAANRSPAGALLGPGGKTYEQMTNAERKALSKDDPELFAQLRKDATSSRT